MNVTYEPRLKDYMAKKGYTHIVIDLISPIGCVADSAELLTRFAKPKEAAQIKERGCRVVPGEVGEILVVERGIHFDEDVTLGLRSFLGAKDITLKGIVAWKL